MFGGETLHSEDGEDDEGLPPGFRDFMTMVEDEEGSAPPSAGTLPPSAMGTPEPPAPVLVDPHATPPAAAPPPAAVPPSAVATASGTAGSSRSGTGRQGQQLDSRHAPGSSHAEDASPKELNIEPGTIFEVRPGLKLILEKVLGQGGMGVVYLVQDPKIGRRMALKLIRGKQSSARVMRFTRETKVTARLNHPGIPPVNEAGTTSTGIHYLLMRFVEGESLKRRLRRMWSGNNRPQSHEIRELLQALVRMGEAVAYAHNERVIHRDLKPENIMIGAFGEVFVMDWGLARTLDESVQDDVSICEALAEKPAPNPRDSDAIAAQGLTRVGATLGTVGYMAPEQARGEVIDQRADIFSLGVILTRILTGRSALGDEPLQRLDRTINNQVLTPYAIDKQVPAELNAIAEKATNPDRQQRYDSAEGFVEDVQAFLEGRKVSAYTYRPIDEALRFVRKNPAAVVGALAFVLFVIGAIYYNNKLETNRELARKREAKIEAERKAQEEEAERERERLEEQRQLERERMEEDARKEREQVAARRSTEVSNYLALGKAALEEDDPKQALEEFNKALALDQGNVEAKLGKLKAENSISKALEGERDRVAQQRDREKAERYELDAESALRRGDFKAAMELSDLAVAFGSTKGKALRDQALEGRAAELTQQKKEEFRKRARERVAQAKPLIAHQPQQALRLYYQALAFDSENTDAKKGAEMILKRMATHEARQEQARRHRDAVALVEQTNAILERAKQAYLDGESTLVVLDQHLQGLEIVDRALFLHPESAEAKKAKQDLGQQLAAILRQEGHSKFEAEFVLKFSGTEPGTGKTRFPKDPHLEIREGDAVRIRQVLGTTRFKRTKVFKNLRKYVKNTFPDYRIIIVVRSKPIPGDRSDPIPKIQLTGLWVQVEDKRARTIRPPTKIPVEGTYVRPMTTDKLGRIIGSFDEARQQSRIRWQPIVSRIENLSRRLLRDAKR